MQGRAKTPEKRGKNAVAAWLSKSWRCCHSHEARNIVSRLRFRQRMKFHVWPIHLDADPCALKELAGSLLFFPSAGADCSSLQSWEVGSSRDQLCSVQTPPGRGDTQKGQMISGLANIKSITFPLSSSTFLLLLNETWNKHRKQLYMVVVLQTKYENVTRFTFLVEKREQLLGSQTNTSALTVQSADHCMQKMNQKMDCIGQSCAHSPFWISFPQKFKWTKNYS